MKKPEALPSHTRTGERNGRRWVKRMMNRILRRLTKRFIKSNPDDVPTSIQKHGHWY